MSLAITNESLISPFTAEQSIDIDYLPDVILL